jgi:hypothetical protein
MMAQALTYEEKFGVDLHEFFISTQNSFTEQPFIRWSEQVRAKYADLKATRRTRSDSDEQK